MKKSTIAFIVVILALGAYFVIDAQKEGLSLLQFFSEDRKTLESLAMSFMEDIQFKDFDKAASYHHPDDRAKQDIPLLIERIFQIKPEMLDIMNFSILDTQMDSSQKRGRVKVKTKVHRLNTDDFRDVELMLYFHNQDGKWYMELESSLRKL